MNLIDFGLSKRYKDQKGKHIECKTGKSLTGTARYSSISTHMGLEQSRRDDLESVCYVLLYFLRGNLPWQGLPVKTKREKYEKIMNSKMNTPMDELCKGAPNELQEMLKYCKGLRFDEDPDYSLIKGWLKDAFIRHGFEYDFMFDWNVLEPIVEGRSNDASVKTEKINSRFKFGIPARTNGNSGINNSLAMY